MTQLCKHFGHKVPAEVEGDSGRVSFAMGQAQMQADDAALVVVVLAAEEPAVGQLQGIIDSHLQRFAFREDFTALDWSPVQAA